MVVDHISFFVNKLKNASLARNDEFSMPSSKMIVSISECLKKNGYIKDFEVKSKTKPTIHVYLSYTDGKPAVNDVKRISKPSRRMYSSAESLKPIKNGYGASILSTPKGILSDSDAKKEMVGGEVLFVIW